MPSTNSKATLPLARPATIPRVRVAETERKAISYQFNYMKKRLVKNADGTFLIFENDFISQIILQGKPWEPHFREVIRLIQSGDHVLDGGANFGYNAVMMGSRVGSNGRILAFEPQRLIMQQLHANFLLNDIHNAFTFKRALSNQSGVTVQMSPVDYNSPKLNIGDTSVGTGGESVLTLKIDDLKLEKFDFLKLDIQGYEVFALQGAKESLARFKPYVFIEIEPHQLAKHKCTPQQVVDLLKGIGYKIFNIRSEYPSDYICSVNKVDEILRLNLHLVEV
jgi:FkbM family methyltransferase